jgi:urate oxidase
MVQLGFNRYGKAEVHVVSVRRDGDTHTILDRDVSSALSGEMEAVHVSGDNSTVLPTDTQKNTAFAFAKSLGQLETEAYALALAEHYVTSQPTITRARVAIDEYTWDRISTTGHSFARNGSEVRTTVVIHDQELGTSIVSGIKDLVVMNSTASEFWGYIKDQYTTIEETSDRILATQVSLQWRFRPEAIASLDWGKTHESARTALLEAFSQTYSYSLQQTIYKIAEAIMAAVPEICEIRMALPNKHHFLVDMTPFGMTNDPEDADGLTVYYAADRPYGLIEGEFLADDAPDAGRAWT